jgi:hypothetical protein
VDNEVAVTSLPRFVTSGAAVISIAALSLLAVTARVIAMMPMTLLNAAFVPVIARIDD